MKKLKLIINKEEEVIGYNCGEDNLKIKLIKINHKKL